MKEIRGKSTGPRKIASQKAGSQADRREGRIKGKEGSVVRTNTGIKVGVLALKNKLDILYTLITPGPGVRQRQGLLASSLVEKMQGLDSERGTLILKE